MGTTPARQRRQPERTELYRLVRANLLTFRAQVEAGDRSLPGFVWRELEEYLRCGILAYGFCRVHCDACGKDELVAFSCKRRGFCPSCTGRRMADLAAHLVDSVLPDVRYRQWVLSLPFFVRRLCAFDAALCAAVRRVLVKAVNGFYLRRAGGTQSRPRCGAVVFVQRFDSALKLNVHFHGIWADGVFDAPVGGGVGFEEVAEITDADVAKLAVTLQKRVLRLLQKRGKLPAADAPADDPAAGEVELQDELVSAAVQGLAALGERRGCRDARVGRGSRDEPLLRAPLCADVGGFSLHAAVVVPVGARIRLEKLCRYAARPPLAQERLSVQAEGLVVYKLKKRWRDGSTHVVMDAMTLLERLCALVPPPRKKLLTYHGVFAPAASCRPQVVPAVGAEGEGCRHRSRVEVRSAEEPGGVAAKAGQKVPHAPRKVRIPRSKYSWAELLRRVFLIEVLMCPWCHGRRRLLAGVFAAESTRQILEHLGLPTEAPEVAPARSPPQRELPW